MAISDIEKMIAVGLIWGTTNALMRKGALIWDQKSLKSSQSQTSHLHLHQRIILSLQNYLNLILTWQYSIPLFLNLSASATFFAILGHTPISLAVPVTNATTFAATAVMGMLLGEKTRVGNFQGSCPKCFMHKAFENLLVVCPLRTFLATIKSGGTFNC